MSKIFIYGLFPEKSFQGESLMTDNGARLQGAETILVPPARTVMAWLCKPIFIIFILAPNFNDLIF